MYRKHKKIRKHTSLDLLAGTGGVVIIDRNINQ
ncbi:hypothetical protein SAMN05444337_0273 [Flavobacterium haoranii]|uniref:Uncharacterized protein n=1 Tax=Flavobacterium haoranii TaxID=683124 RepID=A0A1M6C436_9FLAO|nr:hypothetical protein SAMN05444337_0273 [Flavobacterium haoranii]